MYNTILLPTDGSLEMANAIEHCLYQADLNDATLHALYVVDIRAYIVLPEETQHRVVDLLKEEGNAGLKFIEHRAEEREIPIHTELRVGVPHDVILEYTHEADVDLIVMGTHGRTGEEKRIVGSVAEEVVRNSDVPVLTVPMSEAESQKMKTEIPSEQQRYIR